MYSAVLMLALTAGSETAEFGRNRCHGCSADYSGCCPTVVAPGCSTAYGRGYGCSAAYTCSSGYGSGCAGSCHGGLFSRRERGCHCKPAYTGCTVYSTCPGCTSGPMMVPSGDMKKGEELKKLPKTGVQAPAPATIVVSLPADARLTVDGASTSSTSDRRTLVTPSLESGVSYVYSMQAEVVRDGRTVTEVQNVTIRGGETTTVQFQFAQSVASR